MTWIIGVSTLNGFGVQISDIKVTLTSGKSVNNLQKTYKISNDIICSFSGSVKIGFKMVGSLKAFVKSKKINDPEQLIKAWAIRAKSIYNKSDKDEKALTSTIIVSFSSPSKFSKYAPFPATFLAKLESPEFKLLSTDLSLMPYQAGCLSSQKYEQLKYNQIVQKHTSFNPFTSMAYPLFGWSHLLLIELATELTNRPFNGVSNHLNMFIVGYGNVCMTPSNRKTMPLGTGNGFTAYKMPKLASSYEEFNRRIRSLYKIGAAGARC